MNRQNKLKIALWNANGLCQHIHELKSFLLDYEIDILLVAETHLTSKSYVKIPDYKLFHTNHPDNKAHGGTAVIIRQNIKCIEMDAYKRDNIQATTIQIEDQSGFLTISSTYCPPKYNNTSTQYLDYLRTLGSRFIAGGDYNAKNTAWGSRLTNKKGNELLDAIKTNKSDHISTGEPTYWPTDMKKKPDLIDFYIYKSINRYYLTIESNYDLSSDHSPIFLTFLTTPDMEINHGKPYNKNTDWNDFREILRHTLNHNVPLKSEKQIDSATAHFADSIMDAVSKSTTFIKTKNKNNDIPNSIKQAIKSKRRLRKEWQTTRYPADKAQLNKMTKDIKEMLKNFEDKKMQNFLSNLDPTKSSNYSLWRTTSKIKKTTPHQHAILNENNTWAKTPLEKANALARHFKKTFTNQKDTQNYNLPAASDTANKPIKRVTPGEIRRKIEAINTKKSPGYDKINGRILKELHDDGIIYLRNIFNSSIRLKHFPLPWKVSEIIALPKPNKDASKPSSYRPISLLPILSKLFENLIHDRLDPIIQAKNITPSHQFGFRHKHSTIQQVHRVTNKIISEIDKKNYCVATYLDVAKAFDSVWHTGLLYKLKQIFPLDYYLLLRSYLSDRYFYVKHQDECSEVLKMDAGVPQGSVLGPLLYIIYTYDIPYPNDDSMIATFADDTVLITSDKDINIASSKLQNLIDTMLTWFAKWGIQVNADKTVQVIYTNRKYNHRTLTINNTVITQNAKAKYLGMIIDAKLTWKDHIIQKRNEVKNRFRQLYWLLNKDSKLSVYNKLLIYKTMIIPIWRYGIELWGTASKSNIQIIQRLQSKILRTIVNAPWYITNEDLHRDLKIDPIKDVIQIYSTKHTQKLLTHSNNEVKKIPHMELTQKLRLKRITPTALADTKTILTNYN